MKQSKIIIATLITLLSVFSIKVHASEWLDDDTTPNPISKKELKNIEKTYKYVWDKQKYYKVTKAIKLKVQFYDNDSEKITTTSFINIPKGTIVNGEKTHLDSGKNSFTTGYDTLSYHLLKGSFTPSMNTYSYNASVNAKTMASLNKYFVRVMRPNFMPAYSSGSLYAYPKNVKKFSPFGAITDRIKITPDGYLEFTKNNSPYKETNKEFNLTPNASVKITKSILKNNARYFYYAHHLQGVNDQKVSKSGKSMYRLVITNMHKPFSMFDGDQGAVILSKYKISKDVYYTRSGAFSA